MERTEKDENLWVSKTEKRRQPKKIQFMKASSSNKRIFSLNLV